MTGRRVVKSLAESVATTGITALARRLTRGRVAVLAYHNVVLPQDTGRGDTSLHLALPAFLEQLSQLARTHEIVDLRTACGDSDARQPRAVITFDDAYRGAVTLALPELARRGIPATVFVSPALLGTPLTWWDAMAEAGLLTEQSRNAAFREYAGRGTAVLAAAFPNGNVPALPDSYGIATLAELRASCVGSIAVGSHAWAHEHLPSLSTPELTESLTRSLTWVLEFGAGPEPWLALPYGAGDTATGQAALRLGYGGALRVSGGTWRTVGDRTLVPRINVPSGLSPRGLEIRTSGLPC